MFTFPRLFRGHFRRFMKKVEGFPLFLCVFSVNLTISHTDLPLFQETAGGALEGIFGDAEDPADLLRIRIIGKLQSSSGSLQLFKVRSSFPSSRTRITRAVISWPTWNSP